MQKLEESRMSKAKREQPESGDVHEKTDAVAQTLHKNGGRPLAVVQDSPATSNSKTTVQ
jgi:hypothetical protein